VNGRSFRVAKARTITLPSCELQISVPETRVPGGGDERELGIIVDGFS
jgi:hypothetical protein